MHGSGFCLLEVKPSCVNKLFLIKQALIFKSIGLSSLMRSPCHPFEVTIVLLLNFTIINLYASAVTGSTEPFRDEAHLTNFELWRSSSPGCGRHSSGII